MKPRLSQIPGGNISGQNDTAIAFTPDLTDDQLKELAREGLSELLQTVDPKSHPSLFLSVVRETMDRLEGKPTQRVAMEARVVTMTNAERIEIARKRADELLGAMALRMGMIEAKPISSVVNDIGIDTTGGTIDL